MAFADEPALHHKTIVATTAHSRAIAAAASNDLDLKGGG
jgi:hypothetical protein